MKEIELKIGQKYTLYTLSGIASTLRKEVTVTELQQEPEKRYGNDYRFGTYKVHRGRKLFYLQFDVYKSIVIEGWGHLKTDAEEHHSFSGNACLNIAGSINQVKELVEKNINPNFLAHDTILAWPHSHVDMEGGEGLLVYPDAQTDHAVILGMRDKLKTNEGGSNSDQ